MGSKAICLLSLSLGIVASLPAQDRPPNVVVILSDQLQAARLHTYGNSRPTSPNIDKLAAEGVQFSRFYSVAPWTAPSQGAIATSQYPSVHGETLVAIRNTPPAFKPETLTLAQCFQKSGYQTAAFINNGVAGKYLLGRGFDTFDEQPGWDMAPQSQPAAVNARVLHWLDANQSKPFFMYVLYYQPHYPYMPPPEHDLFKNSSYPNETVAGYEEGQKNLFRWAKVGDRRAVDRTIQLYDGYVHYMDAYLGELMGEFRNGGLFENTIFLFTSDHGELLFSHPEDYLTADHRSLYDPVLKVPAILWGKGVPSGKKILGLASNVDIAPTLLDLSGLPPKPDAQGKSLVPLVRGQVKEVNHYVFAEQDMEESLRSVRDATYKLIWNLSTGQQQLFNTIHDPAEMQDIAAAFPDVVNKLSDVLQQWRQQYEPDPIVRDAWWKRLMNGQFPAAAPAAPASVSEGNVIDDVHNGTNFHLTGDGWRLSNHKEHYRGGAYWTEPMGPDQPLRTAIWRPNDPMFGLFRVSMWFGGLTAQRAASNVPVTVVTREGTEQVTLDQSSQTGQWVSLGLFQDPLRVMLTNEADGPVIADAVRFERLE